MRYILTVDLWYVEYIYKLKQIFFYVNKNIALIHNNFILN
jgi:hypothetical protein